MQASALTLSSLTLIGVTMAGVLVPMFKINADNRIVNQLTAANVQSNANISTKCFNYYLPILNQISKQLSVDYEKCYTTTTTTYNNMSTGFNESVFIEHAKGICDDFSKCSSESVILKSFNCYASTASSNAMEIYMMSANAVKAALSLKSGLNETQRTQVLCANDADTNYVKHSAEIYDELSACFVNGLPATSTADSTSTIDPAGNDYPSSIAEPSGNGVRYSTLDPPSSADPPTSVAPFRTSTLTSVNPIRPITSAASGASRFRR